MNNVFSQMKIIKTYNKFKESLSIDLMKFGHSVIDIFESMSIWHEVLLGSISAEEKDIFETFKLPKDFYSDKLDIDFLSSNIEFINSLSSISLKKSAIQNTDDFECFVNKPCKFMFIYDINSNELENPVYILFQVWNSTISRWDLAKLFKVNGDVRKFYDKLTSKVVEIEDNGVKYIYQSSNKNEWVLQNTKENDTFKKYFRKEDFEKFINDGKFKITLI